MGGKVLVPTREAVSKLGIRSRAELGRRIDPPAAGEA
jgi:hypothetical protein